MTPHSYRRQSIHAFILMMIGFIVIILAFSSCRTQRTGCESLYHKKKRFTAYFKNMITDSVYILNKEGAIVCSFKSKH